MIVSALISKLRSNYGDKPTKHLDSLVGDGSSVVFKTKYSPVLETGFGLYIDDVLKTKDTDYEIDLDTGDIVLTTATTGTIDFKYKSAYKRDNDWLGFIQSGIRGFGDEFYRSVTRSPSAFTISAGVQVYDLPSTCIRPTEVYESSDYTSAGTFVPLNVNHWYDRRSNKLILGAAPTRANVTQMSYLRRIQVPQSTSATLDLEENWIEMLELKTGAIFARAMAMEIATQGNASVEEGHLSVQSLTNLSREQEAQFQLMKRRNRPVMPNYAIPYYQYGKGYIQNP